MPWLMSRLVLQPRISTVTDCISARVGVSVGVIGVLVKVGDGISVFVGVLGERTVTPGTISVESVGVIIMGVAVIMPGVRDGMGVHTGNGCGETPHASHAVRKNIRIRKADVFFILLLYILNCLNQKQR